MNVNDLLDRLTSLKSDKKAQTQRVKARSHHREKFIDMMRNNQFDFSKKYELPQIMTKNDESMVKSHHKTKR
jgi:dephospho-CoA kinase